MENDKWKISFLISYMTRYLAKLPALLLASTILSGTLLQTHAPLGSNLAFAQDTRELQKETTTTQAKKGPHPLTELMHSANSRLRPELRGRHPRVYVTDSELESLRRRARTTHTTATARRSSTRAERSRHRHCRSCARLQN
jgi:hypothetical protein